MKHWKLVITGFILLFFFYSPSVEAQATPRRTTVRVVNANRPVKRKIRRKKRRVRRRTLRRLPANTRALVWRNVSYYPVGGMYYIARKGAYVRAFPPRGFRVRAIPALTRLMVRGAVYYYSAGVFYRNVEDQYEVIDAPIGAVVKELPEDAEEMDFNGITTYELNETLYKAIDDGYEVIELLEEDN
jgi:hypothetical protein